MFLKSVMLAFNNQFIWLTNSPKHRLFRRVVYVDIYTCIFKNYLKHNTLFNINHELKFTMKNRLFKKDIKVTFYLYATYNFITSLAKTLNNVQRL